ncbi:distal tail protein Dit [Clostridium sp. BSD9I1]|uniref:distal tail protein Dit n=1 Tax=Clostridium sp. BSD9I1 TaxID=2003589 RepID=UPI001646EE61|nr:distal tail protein Dit [Clostridium sp. BSD9I1]
MRGFKFNDKHSYNDYKLLLEKKTILPPGKKKIKLDVPYANGTYDFSTVATNGEVVFEERKIEVLLGIAARSKEHLHVLYSNILEWITDTGRQQLIFDDICDYYFIAEVEGVTDFQEVIRFGKLKVTFTAQPFKIGVNLEGSDIWDTFNFEEDVVQDTEFDVLETKTETIINVGRPVTPIINVNAPMDITINNKNYNLNIGDNKIYGLKLQPGENVININGTGHIKFMFRKERL